MTFALSSNSDVCCESLSSIDLYNFLFLYNFIIKETYRLFFDESIFVFGRIFVDIFFPEKMLMFGNIY
jgi:hypothetical protein